MKDEDLEKLRKRYEYLYVTGMYGEAAGVVLVLCLLILIMGCLYLTK